MASDSLETRPADSPRYKRLRDSDKALALKLRDDGLTQVQIAQRLGCAQSSVSDWLTQCADTVDLANRYLRGQSLRMAESVVEDGKPDVKLKALQGLGVASENSSGPAVVIQIGGAQQDISVSFACSTQQLTGAKD